MLNWCDGQPAKTQGEVDALNKLIREMQAAEKEAEACRVEEVAPLNKSIDEIQSRYNALIGKTTKITGKSKLAISAAKKMQEPFLIALSERLEEEKRQARAEADRRQAQVDEAFRQSSIGDLAAREAAERIAADAAWLQGEARIAEKARATAKGGTGRASSLRLSYEPEITDMQAFARWCWAERRPELNEFFTGQAKHLVFIGKREIPGVTVHEKRTVI